MPLVADAIERGRAAGLDRKKLLKFVHVSFPWGARGNHPYEIWKSEAAHQLGISRKRNAGNEPMPLFEE